MKMRVRHLVEQPNGAFYYQATKPMRAAGMVSEPLGRDRSHAVKRAEDLNKDWDLRRKGEDVRPAVARGTMLWLVRHYEGADEYKILRGKTLKSVDPALAVIVKRLGDVRASAIERKHVRALHKALSAEVSADHGNRIVRELRKLFRVAMDEGLRTDNPATDLRLPGSPARDQVWPEADVLRFVAAADAMERPSLGTAALLMYELAHSPIDARLMTWASYVGGAFRFRRSKTNRIAGTGGKLGKLIDVPATQRLAARLSTVARASPVIVVSEGTGAPYKEYDFNHWCRKARRSAGIDTELQMMDLRRSRTVNLAEAGATAFEIAAVTGQSVDQTQRILDVYVPRTSAMAKVAIAKGERARRKAERGTKV